MVKTTLKRVIWLISALVLAVGLVVELPILRHSAGATEVTIDSDVHGGLESHNGSGSNVVFVSDQTGYVFYVDSGGDCVYAKTTNGGTSWGGITTFDSQTDCLMPTVWYDRWTPGDTTGNYIHIVTKDPGNDDLWYNRLDTSGDTLLLSSSVAVTTDETNTFGASANPNTYPAITRATDGDLYVGVEDDTSSYVLKCTGSCDTASNWTSTEAWTAGFGDTNAMVLLPQAAGDLIAIHNVHTSDGVYYQTYDESADDWSQNAATWTLISTAITENLRPNLGAVVDPLTYDVYISAVDTDGAGTGANLDDISVWRYNGSWTALAEPVNNYNPSADDNDGLVWTKMGFNTNNTTLYVSYIAEATAGTATTRNIYYKSCNYTTSGGCNDASDWSAESSALNSGADEYDSINVNLSSRDRIYVIWDDKTDEDLRGETAADLVRPTYTMQVYRWLANADNTTGGSALASENNSATITNVGDAFRLRILLRVGGDGARTSLDNLKLQYAAKSGTCDTAYSGEAYADVTTSIPISYKNNATPSDGANLTANASNDPTDSVTINNQTYEEVNNFTNSTNYIPTGEDGMWDFAIYEYLAPSSASFCLRVIFSDGSAVATPVVVPEVISAACTTGTTTDQLMRHGKIFANEAEEKLCSAN